MRVRLQILLRPLHARVHGDARRRTSSTRSYVKQHAAGPASPGPEAGQAAREIAIGTATDPYQPAERRYEVTRAILEEFALHRGFDLGIVTKSNLVLRDLELFRRSRAQPPFMKLTITTLDAELARVLEPRAPRPDLRLEAVRQLNRAGVRRRSYLRPRDSRHHRLLAIWKPLVEAAAQAGAKYLSPTHFS